MLGTGDSCQLRAVSGSLGRVPAAAVAPLAPVVTYAAAAHGIHATCSDSYWGPTATAFAPACTASYHFDDSSSTAHRASESGTASSSVHVTSSTGVPVVSFTWCSPAVHSLSHGFLTRADFFAIRA